MKLVKDETTFCGSIMGLSRNIHKSNVLIIKEEKETLAYDIC